MEKLKHLIMRRILSLMADTRIYKITAKRKDQITNEIMGLLTAYDLIEMCE